MQWSFFMCWVHKPIPSLRVSVCSILSWRYIPFCWKMWNSIDCWFSNTPKLWFLWNNLLILLKVVQRVALHVQWMEVLDGVSQSHVTIVQDAKVDIISLGPVVQNVLLVNLLWFVYFIEQLVIHVLVPQYVNHAQVDIFWMGSSVFRAVRLGSTVILCFVYVLVVYIFDFN